MAQRGANIQDGREPDLRCTSYERQHRAEAEFAKIGSLSRAEGREELFADIHGRCSGPEPFAGAET